MNKKESWKEAFDKVCNEAAEDLERAYNSTETIWDYNPTEKELKKIGEKTGYTQEEIITASRTGEGRFWCLETLFDLRGNKEDLARVERWHAICFPYFL
ncbi:hypothetical protein J6Y50_07080 [bacterium]|nr:hypothetical protein [bacterium]